MNAALIIAVISLSLAVLGMAVTVVVFMMKLFNKAETTNDTLVAVNDNIATLTTYMHRYMEKSDLFQVSVQKDVEGFKVNSNGQQALCRDHGIKMTTLCNEVKMQNMSQTFMKELFEDVKRLQISTAGAIHDLANAIVKMEMVLKQIAKTQLD